MPTSSFDSFIDGDVIEAHHVSEMHLPVQNLERGKSFFAVADVASSSTTAYTAELEPAPDSPHQTGLFVHLRVPKTNIAGSPDVTLELNGLGPKPILKGDGQSLEAADLLAGQMIALVYDSAAGGAGAYLLVSADRSGPIAWSDLPFEQPSANTLLGNGSLVSNTGDGNTAVGYQALMSNTTGSGNCAVGSWTLPSNTTGYFNVALGISALQCNTEGTDNIAIGMTALYNSVAAGSNIAIGSLALQQNVAGEANVAIGREAGFNTLSSANVAIGYISQRDSTTGHSNTSVGYGALTGNSVGSGNCAVGREALFSSSGSENTGVGGTALRDNQADYNSAFGSRSMTQNTTGHANTAVGFSSLIANTTGYKNCAVGNSSLFSNTEGVQNVAIGSESAAANTSGNNNTIIGFCAGIGLTVGSDNIAIGANIDVAEPTENGQINIGNCLMRNGPRQSVSLRAGSSAFASSSDTAILDLTNLRGWVGFADDGNGWCRLRVNPSGINIEASSADWVASSTPASGEVGLYLSSGSLHMVLGSAAARSIGFSDQTMAF